MECPKSEGPHRVPNREQSMTLAPTDSILSVYASHQVLQKTTSSPILCFGSVLLLLLSHHLSNVE